MTKPFVDPKADLLFPQPRPQWVKEQIDLFNQKLLPIRREEKFKEMAKSPFIFFRGTDHLYWADFGSTHLTKYFGGKKGTRTWLCGDMHCGNFGAFTDANGRLVYDVTDFDETVVADYQFDLWRLVVSLNLLARENGMKPHHRKVLVKACVKGYFHQVEECAMDRDAAWAVSDRKTAHGGLKHFLQHVQAKQGRKRMLERWTTEAGGDFLFNRKNSDLDTIAPGMEPALREALEGYAEDLKPWPVKQIGFFEVKDIALRLHQGIGSYGFNRYYALAEVEAGGKWNYRILDIKLQLKPSPWPHLSKKIKQWTKKECGGNQALRTVLAYRALGSDVDPWLGWLKLGKEEEYCVRERSPYKAALPFEKVDAGITSQMGEVLARAHSRARKNFAPKAWKRLKGREKRFIGMLQVIAHAYADQVTMDYKSFLEERKS